ncbi:response regulator [Malaciobacter sp. WC5094]|uniref:response regulator n=1 Tax=Arcobacter sp. YIC-80 TaxID=3376683 RepID=UPI00384ED0F0
MYENLKNKTVLYIEDDQFIREQTASLLNVVFENVLTANNGEEGLQLFSKNSEKIHAIVTDINMPILTGIQMSKELKSDKNFNTPIIGVSAYSDDDNMLNEANDLFTLYLRKPIEIKDLIDAIEEVIL